MKTIQVSLARVFSRQYSPKDILLLAFVILCLNAIFSFLLGRSGYSWPYNSFLFMPQDRFADFLKVIDAMHITETWKGTNPYEGFLYYQYILPFSATLYLFFAKIIAFTSPQAGLILFYTIILTIFYRQARINGNTSLIILLSILSYPIIIAVDRGNFALVVGVCLLVGLSISNIRLATLAIAMATSIKITPAVFLVVVLFKEQLTLRRIFTIGILFLGWMLLINLICIQVNGHFLTPSEYNPMKLLSALLGLYEKEAVYQMRGLPYNSAMYLPAAYIAKEFGIGDGFFKFISPIILAVWVCFLIALCLFLTDRLNRDRIKSLLSPEKLTFVLCLMFVLLMPVTADYYLIIAFIPLLIYRNVNFSFGYFLFYGLLLAAKNFVFLEVENSHPVSLQVFINPLLLTFLLFAEFDLIPFMKRFQFTKTQ